MFTFAWSMVGTVVVAQETNRAATVNFEAFRLITERNIFNANRSGRGQRTGREVQRRPAQIESFALVGTISYADTKVAFFDGSGSQYRKALRCAEQIAGYQIREITPQGVKLERDGKATDLRVGMQVRREDEGEWKLSERSEFRPASTTSASSVASEGGSGAATSGGEVSDVLKRLMEKREKELQ